MKKINEMSELEINNLTDEDVEKLIKLAKLENGIKLLSFPESPIYEEIEEPDLCIYQNTSLYELRFTDENEAKKYNEMIESFKSIVSTDYQNDSKYTFVKKREIRINLESKKCYSFELYQKVKEIIKRNSIVKRVHEDLVKEYRDNEELSKEIVSVIYDTVSEVRKKYNLLNHYCRLFKNDYMPLSENKEKTAIAFFEKAYTISESDKEYILSNYKTCK